MEKENGKINVVVLILIIILVLIAGIAGGYFLGNSLGNKDGKQTIVGTAQTKPQVANTIQNTQTNTANTEVNQNTIPSNVTSQTQTIKYDGSKDITINGKTYTISYNSDIYEHDQDYPVVVNLYFNGKKVRSIDMEHQGGDIEKGEEFNKEYTVEELKNIQDKYILVIIKNESIEFDYEYAKLCVLNLDGEFIGAKEWKKGPESVTLKSNNKNLVRYEILEDGFLIFERLSYATSYADTVYTIKDNKIDFSKNRIYNEDEIVTAGK